MRSPATPRRRLLAGGATATALALTLLLGGCGSDPTATDPTASSISFAHADADSIKLGDGWVSAVAGDGMSEMSDMPGMDMNSMPGMGESTESTAYASVTNSGSSADAVVGVSTPAARSATLHNTVTKGSAGTMVAVTSIPIPAGGTVTLQPGGYHVMLMGLTGDFSVGSSIPMTWHFKSGAAVTTDFPVIDTADRPTPASGK